MDGNQYLDFYPQCVKIIPMSIELEEYTLPEHISYSAFTTYVACGYQYYLGRLLNKQEEPSVWSVGGSAFHLACENYDRTTL
jgi:hypothetical protein